MCFVFNDFIFHNEYFKDTLLIVSVLDICFHFIVIWLERIYEKVYTNSKQRTVRHKFESDFLFPIRQLNAILAV